MASMKLVIMACIFALLPVATEGFNSLKHHTEKRASFLALEMIENRCASQSVSFIRGRKASFGALGEVDMSTGRRLLGGRGVQAADVALAASLTAGKIGVCSTAAQMVDEACQGAPDDRGAATVTNWLQGLACVSAGP
eukprot:CAMPEP_0198207834 /NCGR_PEP_ID=MMETSP1445-20131203/11257_1 /TAXON_ID=36898 /ORGANISM="Pyramimonas sp., Strain CCMP2087" /LENGTH=137 /DNA_ID=CAMNT_0043881001 /DNA_START=133 /DNA_END=546 /DNA_ORIENTATION=+